MLCRYKPDLTMPRPPYVAPVLESAMLEICLDVLDGVSPYPVVDGTELSEGDVVYATLTLKGSDADEEKYALPGTVKLGAEGAMSVELFESGLWSRKGFTEVETVDVKEGLLLRRGAAVVEKERKEPEQDDDMTHISELWEDPSSDVVTVARNDAMDQVPTFKKYMIKEVGKEQNLDARKWDLLKAITVRMAEQLTVKEFRELCPRTGAAPWAAPSPVEVKQFKIDYIDPAREALVADCDDELHVKEYKERIRNLRSATLMKYACMVIGIVVNGPQEEPEEPKQPEKDAGMAKLHVKMDSLLARFGVLSAQIRLGDNGAGAPVGPGKPGEEAKAKILKVNGDHSCAYHVMNAGGVKSLDADAKLDLRPEARKRTSKLARKTVCLEANKVWMEDKTAFEGLYGPYQTFVETIVEERPSSDSWPEFCQWVFYANANPQLEYRIKQRVKGKITTYSTRKAGAAQPPHVMFPVFRRNHYDIAAVEEGGELVYVFPAAKADAAEKLIDAFLKGSKQVLLAKDLGEKELSLVLDGALGLAAGGQGDSEEAFTTVEGRNTKKKRKKAEGEQKAAAAAKRAAAKAEADADARMAKAAVKAATDLFRQSGAGAWAQPLPHRQGGQAWGHHPGGRSTPAVSPPPTQRARSADHTNRTPAVVVFGGGSKRSLRRAIRKLDPAVEQAISAVYKIQAGEPRAVLYCLEEDLETVLSILPRMKADGISCAAYVEQRGGGRGRKDPGAAPPKAKRAEQGLRDASLRAGVCHYMAAGRDCPHSQRGKCKFVCYDQQPGAQRHQPPSPRAGVGWHR